MQFAQNPRWGACSFKAGTSTRVDVQPWGENLASISHGIPWQKKHFMKSISWIVSSTIQYKQVSKLIITNFRCSWKFGPWRLVLQTSPWPPWSWQFVGENLAYSCLETEYPLTCSVPARMLTGTSFLQIHWGQPERAAGLTVEHCKNTSMGNPHKTLRNTL